MSSVRVRLISDDKKMNHIIIKVVFNSLQILRPHVKTHTVCTSCAVLPYSFMFYKYECCPVRTACVTFTVMLCVCIKGTQCATKQ